MDPEWTLVYQMDLHYGLLDMVLAVVVPEVTPEHELVDTVRPMQSSRSPSPLLNLPTFVSNQRQTGSFDQKNQLLSACYFIIIN